MLQSLLEGEIVFYTDCKSWVLFEIISDGDRDKSPESCWFSGDFSYGVCIFFPCDYIRELFCSVCLVHDVHEMSGSILSKIRLLCLWLQCAKEYYEQALMQELKKNQELQEYIRLLENRVHNPGKECRLDKQVYTSHRIARLSSY